VPAVYVNCHETNKRQHTSACQGSHFICSVNLQLNDGLVERSACEWSKSLDEKRSKATFIYTYKPQKNFIVPFKTVFVSHFHNQVAGRQVL
jgi:hypothetical protein